MSSEAVLILVVIIVFDIIYNFLYVRKPKKPSHKYKNQFIAVVQRIIDDELHFFERSLKIIEKPRIPNTDDIPLIDPLRWNKINTVICCFVDMKGSTQLSASPTGDENIAKAYRLFTETAIRIFHEFKSPYIDVKGDGVFALFDLNQVHRALAATISFKTFVHEYFTPEIKAITGQEISGHFGIDQANVLVRKFGLRRFEYRTDRQNEVWAGQPINMAAKLASLSPGNQLWVSKRFFESLNSQGFESILQWELKDLSDPRFSFDTAYIFHNNWSELDGKLQCERLKRLDHSRKIRRFSYRLMNFWKHKIK